MISSSSTEARLPTGSFASATSRRDRLRRLEPSDWLDAGLAAVALPLIRLARVAGGRIHLGPSLPPWTEAKRPSPRTWQRLDHARRVAWVVDAIARRCPWRATSVERSLVLWWLLRRRGLDAELRTGVRSAAAAAGGRSVACEFRAWVECDSVVLNDRWDVRERIATFERVILPQGVTWA